MNTIFSLVQLLVFHFFILLIRAGAEPSSYPLVFNPYISTIYYKPNPDSKINPPIIYPVLSACPAKSDEEIEMNKNQSIDHKAIFVRNFYREDVKVEDMTPCEKNYEMAVAVDHRTKNMRVDFGYEIYFEKSVIPDNAETFKTCPFNKFESILGGRFPIDSPSLAENRPLSFIWIPRIALRYDASFWNLINITYSIHREADRIDVQCNDYNLGKYYLERENFYAYYSKENRNNIFNEVDIPRDSTCQFTEEGCLEMYNLVKPYVFQPTPWSPASCSDLTSIPIWYKVNKQLLNYSEKFLAAISEITDRQLTVIPGGHEVLSLPYKTRSENQIESKEIFLDRVNLRFPVWKIIYKIVKYQSHKCDDKTNLCWFYMVIVIHNQPVFTKKDRLCPRDKCEEWGWESIQYLNTSAKGEKFKHIYCCRMDEIMERKLDLKMDTYYRDDLNLKYFPVFNEYKGENDFLNMQELFLKKMDTLLSASRS